MFNKNYNTQHDSINMIIERPAKQVEVEFFTF